MFKSLIVAVVASMVAQSLASPPALRTACGIVADAEEVVGNKALEMGKAAAEFVLKPIEIVGGLKAAAVGTGMKVGGGAIKFVGSKLVKDGAILEATGAGVKGAGLGVAALGVKPLAEKIVVAGTAAESKVDAAKNFVKSAGESSVQIDATIDSPILGHHHKEVNISSGFDDHQPFKTKGFGKHVEQQQQIEQQQVEQQQVEQQQQQTQQVDQLQVQEIDQQKKQQEHAAKRAAAAKVDPEVLKSALSLVREAHMEDCVARAICDLNCNPQGFGQDGKQVFMNMVRLQGQHVVDQQETKYYFDAASKGRAYSGRCDQCSSHFSKCNSKSADLIKLASHIKMD